MRRGTTIIEVLVSLALLAGLSVAAAGWIELSGHVSASAGPRLAWERSARAVLQTVADDIAAGDTPDLVQPQGNSPRVAADATRLVIHTRHVIARQGSGRIEYRLEDGAIWLIRAGAQEPGTRSMLLAHVGNWSCELDERTKRLSLRIERASGDGSESVTLARSYRLP